MLERIKHIRKTDLAAAGIISVPLIAGGLAAAACRPASGAPSEGNSLAQQANHQQILPTPGLTALPFPYETYLPIVKNGQEHTVVVVTQTPEPTRQAPTATPTPEPTRSATPTPTEPNPTATKTPEASAQYVKEMAVQIEREFKVKLVGGNGYAIETFISPDTISVIYKSLQKMPFTAKLLRPDGNPTTFFIRKIGETDTPTGYLNYNTLIPNGPADITFEIPDKFDPNAEFSPRSKSPDFKSPPMTNGQRLEVVIAGEIISGLIERRGITGNNPHISTFGALEGWGIDPVSKRITKNPHAHIENQRVVIEETPFSSSEIASGTLGPGGLKLQNLLSINHSYLRYYGFVVAGIDQSKLDEKDRVDPTILDYVVRVHNAVVNKTDGMLQAKTEEELLPLLDYDTR